MDRLVCIDRDGTLIYDDSYYLGRQENWQELIEFMPGVVEGIKRMQDPDTGLYMITNQSGVAVQEFSKLTMERAETVCEEILDRLEERGAELDGYFICPHVTPEYAERKEYAVDESMVCECSCIKPRLGMVFDALADEGVAREELDEIYVIGDRASDVETGLNAGGHGILVPFGNRSEEVERLPDDARIADNFLEAAQMVLE